MPDYYMLNTRGLNYLTSSSDSSAIRRFLLYILDLSSRQAVSTQQLLSWKGRSRDVITRLVDKMLELEWIKHIDQGEYNYEQLKQNKFLDDFSELSSTGQVLLADNNGLVIYSRGFEADKKEYVSAAASKMLSINEISRQRNIDLYNGQPWTVTLNWGVMRVRAQYIFLGSKKFVLVLGGKPQLDKNVFFTLLAMLLRRYVNE